MDFIEIAKNAKEAGLKISALNVKIKNDALNCIAKSFEEHKQEIFDANKQDLELAKHLLKKVKFQIQHTIV